MYVERAYCNLIQYLDVPLFSCLGRKEICKNWCGRIEHCYTQAEVSKLQSRFLFCFSLQCEWLHVEYKVGSTVCVGLSSLPLPAGAAGSDVELSARARCEAADPISLALHLPCAPCQAHTSLMLSRETPRHAQDPEPSPGTASFWHSVIR